MYRLIIFIPIIFIFGCKSKDAVPSGVLSQKKMQSVVYDMMRADQFLNDYVLNKDTSLNKKIESTKLYQQVFSINKVTKENFEKSFKFYKEHPALLKVIMDSIATTSDPIVTTTIPLPNKDSLKAVADSIKKVDSTSKLKRVKKPRILKTH